MGGIYSLLTASIAIVVLALSATVLIKLLDGSILTDGMLQTDASGTSYDPERVLALIGTLLAAVYYFFYALQKGVEGNQMPEFPEHLVPFIGGTNLLFLTGKYGRLAGIIK